jgi:hypothetical protein
MRLPTDAGETKRRLAALAGVYPGDAEVQVVLGRYLYADMDDLEAVDATTAALALEPAFGYALYARALAELRLHKEEDALRDIQTCTRVSPAGTSCIETLQQYDDSEGRCEEAEALARQLIALAPTEADGYLLLAHDLYAEGKVDASIAAREQSYHVLDRLDEQPTRVEEEADWAILRGDFDAAYALILDWRKATDGHPGTRAHFFPTRALLDLLIEAGRRDEARAVADDYLRKAAAWSHESMDWDYSFFVEQRKYRAGALSRDAFRRMREASIAADIAHATHDPAYTWEAAYAGSTMSAEDAHDALSAVTRFGGIPDAFTRSTQEDYEIGTTYRLAGDDGHSKEFLERAARSCLSVRYPIWHTRATFDLGSLLERMGDGAGARRAYGVVARRWGSAGSKFPLGAQAIARLRALGEGADH